MKDNSNDYFGDDCHFPRRNGKEWYARRGKNQLIGKGVEHES